MLFCYGSWKKTQNPQRCCCPSSAYVASGSWETWGLYSQAPQQASCAWFRASGFAFPQVAFSKSNNILCVSVARADAARPRIETFLPRRNDSQASRPASLSDNRLSHTTEHFKMPFPKNTKNTCKTHFVSLIFAPVGGICSSRNHIYARSRNGADNPKNGMGSGDCPKVRDVRHLRQSSRTRTSLLKSWILFGEFTKVKPAFTQCLL